MIAKTGSAGRTAKALPGGAVVILDGRSPNTILAEVLSDEGAGTIIYSGSKPALRGLALT